MRRGNLELRKYNGKNRLFEIIKWYENPHYGHIDEYEKSRDGFYVKVDGDTNYQVHESCFKNPESCYMIASIKDGIPDFVGDRCFELDSLREVLDFLWLLRSGIKKSLRWKDNSGAKK